MRTGHYSLLSRKASGGTGKDLLSGFKTNNLLRDKRRTGRCERLPRRLGWFLRSQNLSFRTFAVSRALTEKSLLRIYWPAIDVVWGPPINNDFLLGGIQEALFVSLLIHSLLYQRHSWVRPQRQVADVQNSQRLKARHYLYCMMMRAVVRPLQSLHEDRKKRSFYRPSLEKVHAREAPDSLGTSHKLLRAKCQDGNYWEAMTCKVQHNMKLISKLQQDLSVHVKWCR